MIKNISNLGDAALYCDFGNEVNKSINSQVIKYFKTIKEKKFEGINNLTPSYNKLIISYDLKKTNFKKVKNYVENINPEDSIDINSKKLEIPVCCHENFSMDIKRLEEILKLSREKILENFLNKEYFCYMTGFIAGMPFLGDLDDSMRAQRFESPGGWNILGNTPLDVFDSSKEDKPNLINPGDTVIFKEISLDQYKNYNE